MLAPAALPALAARLLALLAGAACMLALRHYPLGHGWPGLLFTALLPAYFLLLRWRPACWLFCVPALLPVLDLAPWTGRFFLEEIDVLLMLTVACGYWRLGGPAQSAAMQLAPCARACLLLCTLAWLAALLRGVLPLPSLDVYAWDNYLSPYNSLRLGKAWAWSMLLLPLLLRDGDASALRRYALPGMLAGLAMVSLFALWERAVFPGLMNLSSDYRITAPFSAMHTGGAALDGYLALSLPFAGLWLARARSRWQAALALLLLALALHAACATFSRGLYAALAAALAALLLLAFWQTLRVASGAARQQARWLAVRGIMLRLLLAGLGSVLLVHMFSVAGYRGLLAAVLLLAASFVLAARPLPWRLAPASVLCALCLQGLLASWWPLGEGQQASGLLKGPYFLFSLATVLLAVVLLPGPVGPCSSDASQPARLSLAMMAWTMLACNVVWIGWHWAGARALAPAGLVVLLAMLMLCNGRLHPPLWRLDRTSLSMAGAGAIVLLLAIPISASYYATERFANTAFDMQGRLRHWRQVLAMQPSDWKDQLFGMGMGSFPATYYWHNPAGEVPASIAYAPQNSAPGNYYVRLASPGYSAGYGELLRLLQRLPVQPATRYTLALDARRTDAMPLLLVRLCQRQLLYAQNCAPIALRLRLPQPDAAASAWQHYEVPFDSGSLGAGAWLLRPPVQLELAASGTTTSSVIDIDNLSLRAPGGEELIANGDFAQANNYWFFSSDHHHLPWHIKSLALHLVVETGWCGALSMLVLLVLAGLRLLRQGVRAQTGQGALACVAALLGFLVVGLFDSLLDVPRIAVLFYLMLLCALLQPPPPLAAESAPP
ncbi:MULTISPECIES: hypothetical protein [unclassified Janthinobacterium]|uniref:hypothetical protein n=1 Tax=unclassified Janthinobacterium TaxID=2610881 RepID=UPI0018CA6FE3|nr:hypothetical protein [Janthinobacterium sp. CG_23.4]MDH6158011.1 hypothetical protein [Janthinobacterium sp. CG_23.4]